MIQDFEDVVAYAHYLFATIRACVAQTRFD
jgi:hypothetical protein